MMSLALHHQIMDPCMTKTLDRNVEKVVKYGKYSLVNLQILYIFVLRAKIVIILAQNGNFFRA